MQGMHCCRAVFLLWIYGSFLFARGVKLRPYLTPYNIKSAIFEPCKGKGECFSGAWLGHISHLIDNPKLKDFFPDDTLGSAKSQVRCEDASFFFFHKMFDTRVIDTWGESPVQTIDMFDFSVLHLSSTERLLHSCINRTKEGWARHGREMESVLKALALFISQKNAVKIRDLALDRLITASSILSPNDGIIAKSSSPEAVEPSPVDSQLSRTLVVIPFLLSLKGESGTLQTYRQRNLKLAFWSLYPLFKSIIGAVVSPSDRVAATKLLPFKEVLQFEESYLNGGTCGLPMAALLEIRRRLLTDADFRASYDYIYFTEGDQILLARKLPQLFSFLSSYPYGVLTPHRLVVVSPLAMAKYHRPPSSVSRIAHYHSRYSCCFDTGGYAATRNHWKPLSNRTTTITTIFGAYVVAGNANFFDQTYRSCNVTKRVEQCPQDSSTETYLAYTDEPTILMKHFRHRVETKDPSLPVEHRR